MKKTIVLIIGAITGLLLIIIISILSIFGTDLSCKTNVDSQAPVQSSKGGTSGGSWNNKGSKVYKDMKYASQRFKQMGYSGDQTATVLAIGWKESNFDPTIVNPGGAVKGIFQWGTGGVNGNRYGNTKDNVESQMDLVDKELNGSYKHVATKLSKATSMEQAEEAWNVGYEGEGLPAGD
ncbi:hypothetical protein JOC36_000935 [Weissella uvarum]|uniref:phage tail tip lysozyme n=1 Tax=Weissella uvarum TaxID=1479233 RepID=UPI0019605D0A|nr:phage tail tip lysozyme [Weissella uvarum]MBM7617378.1 hypothetical protein [Weissella uvarum]MCM0595735.1 hypothetical protein [Weissella uvarum]